jgi:hypothetical protein
MRRWLGLALGLATIAACRRTPRKAPPSQPPPAAAEPATLTLLEPGVEPRRALRIATEAELPAGQTTFRMTARTGGHSASVAAAPLEQVFTLTLAASRPAPGQLELTITDARAQGPESDPAAVRMMLGERVHLGLDDHDQASQLLAALADGGPDPDLAGGLGQIFVPLPSAPVGQGARWQVRRRRTEMEVERLETWTYTLTSIRGDVIEVAAEIRATAAQQPLHYSDLGAGESARLTSFTSTSSASLVLDLAQPWPRTYERHDQETQGVDFVRGGETSHLDYVLDQRIELIPP